MVKIVYPREGIILSLCYTQFMDSRTQKKVLILALFAGEIMMKSGAEVYRVEDTVIRICKACKIDYVECLVTTTSISLSLDTSGAENDMHTFTKRIKSSNINLDRISSVNTFSRIFTTTDLSIDDGFEQLKDIAASKSFSIWLRLLGAILVGAFFCPLFQGTSADMLIAGGISAISYLISTAIQKLSFPNFIRIFISCAGAAGLVLFAALLGAGESITPVIIASTTIFLPGVAITNAARDFLSGDMLSGVARFTEALIDAVAIAGGIAIGIRIWLLIGGTISSERVGSFEDPWFLVFGFFSTLGFCILFNSPRKHIFVASLIGAVGMYLLVLFTDDFGMLNASFIGACVVAVLSEIASRAGKDATTIFIIPGIISFVPGSLLYQTMNTLLKEDYVGAAAQGTQAILIAGSIAIALVLVATITRLIKILFDKLHKNP